MENTIEGARGAASGAISGADFSHIKDIAQDFDDDYDESKEPWSRQNTRGCFGVGAEVFAIHSRQVTVASNDQHMENTVEGARDEASPLQRELEESQAELAELRAQFAENNVVGALRKQLMQMQEMKKENEALRQEVPAKKAQSSLPALQDLFSQCGAIVEQNDNLMSEMEKLKQHHEALASDYKKLACNHQLLSKQSVEQRKALNTLQDEKAVLKHESDMTQQSYDCLSNLYVTVLDEQEDLQFENEALLRENDGLKSTAASFATVQKSFMTTQAEESYAKQEKPVQKSATTADVAESNEDTIFSLLADQLF
jgi:chromosome segregation ATPase